MLYRQQLLNVFWISQLTYFNIHFQLLLLWVSHGNIHIYIWIIYKCLASVSIWADTIHALKKWTCADSNSCMILTSILFFFTTDLAITGYDSQVKNNVHLCYAVIATNININTNSHSSLNWADILEHLLGWHLN